MQVHHPVVPFYQNVPYTIRSATQQDLMLNFLIQQKEEFVIFILNILRLQSRETRLKLQKSSNFNPFADFNVCNRSTSWNIVVYKYYFQYFLVSCLEVTL